MKEKKYDDIEKEIEVWALKGLVEDSFKDVQDLEHGITLLIPCS